MNNYEYVSLAGHMWQHVATIWQHLRVTPPGVLRCLRDASDPWTRNGNQQRMH